MRDLERPLCSTAYSPSCHFGRDSGAAVLNRNSAFALHFGDSVQVEQTCFDFVQALLDYLVHSLQQRFAAALVVPYADSAAVA